LTWEDEDFGTRSVDGDDRGRVVVGRMLIKALMWTVSVEVVLVLS
jgi:hypothetical protein